MQRAPEVFLSLSSGHASAGEVGHVRHSAAGTRGEQRPEYLPHNGPRARSQTDGCRPCIAAQHMGRCSRILRRKGFGMTSFTTMFC